MKICILLVGLLGSIPCFALQVKCAADSHVLAYYNDGTGKAIERKSKIFSLDDYESVEKPKSLSFDIDGRHFLAFIGQTFDSASTGGTGEPMEGMYTAIVNGGAKDGTWIEAIAPLGAKYISSIESLKGQPGIEPNEISRSYFWSLVCRW